MPPSSSGSDDERTARPGDLGVGGHLPLVHELRHVERDAEADRDDRREEEHELGKVEQRLQQLRRHRVRRVVEARARARWRTGTDTITSEVARDQLRRAAWPRRAWEVGLAPPSSSPPCSSPRACSPPVYTTSATAVPDASTELAHGAFSSGKASSVAPPSAPRRTASGRRRARRCRATAPSSASPARWRLRSDGSFWQHGAATRRLPSVSPSSARARKTYAVPRRGAQQRATSAGTRWCSPIRSSDGATRISSAAIASVPPPPQADVRALLDLAVLATSLDVVVRLVFPIDGPSKARGATRRPEADLQRRAGSRRERDRPTTAASCRSPGRRARGTARSGVAARRTTRCARSGASSAAPRSRRMHRGSTASRGRRLVRPLQVARTGRPPAERGGWRGRARRSNGVAPPISESANGRRRASRAPVLDAHGPTEEVRLRDARARGAPLREAHTHRAAHAGSPPPPRACVRVTRGRLDSRPAGHWWTWVGPCVGHDAPRRTARRSAAAPSPAYHATLRGNKVTRCVRAPPVKKKAATRALPRASSSRGWSPLPAALVAAAPTWTATRCSAPPRAPTPTRSAARCSRSASEHGADADGADDEADACAGIGESIAEGISNLFAPAPRALPGETGAPGTCRAPRRASRCSSTPRRRW